MPETQSTTAWMVTHIGDKASLEVWLNHQRKKAQVVNAVHNLILKMQGRANTLAYLEGQDKLQSQLSKSAWMQGYGAGAATMDRLMLGWTESDLQDLQQIEKDLLAVLGG